jgi:hypothetical protein
MCGADSPFDFAQAGFVREKTKGKTNGRGQECPRHTSQSPAQFVEIVKFTVMLACVSTGCPFCI